MEQIKLTQKRDDFVSGGDTSGFAIAFDASEMLANTETKQTIFYELLASEPTESNIVHTLRPDHHFVGDGFLVSAVIGFTFGKDVPGRDKKSASDSNDSLIGMFMLRKAFVLSVPIGIRANSSPGSLA